MSNKKQNSKNEAFSLEDINGLKPKILKTALEAFSSQGYSGASIRGIASACGTSHQLISHHFGNKESLFEAAIAYNNLETRRRHDQLELIQSIESPREQFALFVRLMVKNCSNYMHGICIFMREALNNRESVERTARYERMLEKYVSNNRETSLAAFARARDAGILVDLPLEDVWYLYRGALFFRFMVAQETLYFEDKSVNDPEIIERHVQGLLKLFLKDNT